MFAYEVRREQLSMYYLIMRASKVSKIKSVFRNDLPRLDGYGTPLSGVYQSIDQFYLKKLLNKYLKSYERGISGVDMP